MRKRGTILIALILCFGLALAQNSEETKTQEEITNDLKNVPGTVANKTKDKLEKEVQIPPSVQPILRILFGIKEGTPVSLEGLIVMIAFWLTFFLILQSAVTFIPFIEDGWQSWVFAAILTTLMAIVGVIQFFTNFFFGLGEDILWLKKLGSFQIFVVVIIGVLLIIGGHKIVEYIKSNSKLTKARLRGNRLGRMEAQAEAREKAFEEAEKAFEEKE